MIVSGLNVVRKTLFGVHVFERWQHHPTRARYSSVVRAFAHGAMGRRIDPSCGEPIELFIVPASAPRLV